MVGTAANTDTRLSKFASQHFKMGRKHHTQMKELHELSKARPVKPEEDHLLHTLRWPRLTMCFLMDLLFSNVSSSSATFQQPLLYFRRVVLKMWLVAP